MVALRSLFLTGLVVAVNSKREIMNEDENLAGFTPVSKITFLQSGTQEDFETMVASKKETDWIKANKWERGSQPFKLLRDLGKFATDFAKEIGVDSKFDTFLTQFVSQMDEYDVKVVVDYAREQLNSLTADDFETENLTRADPKFNELEQRMGQAILTVKEMKYPTNRNKAKATHEEVNAAEAVRKGFETDQKKIGRKPVNDAVELWKYARSISDYNESIWSVVKELAKGKDADNVRKQLKDLAEGKNSDETLTLHAREAAILLNTRLRTLGHFQTWQMKIVCGFAVGVVFGAFGYYVYTRKSDDVRAFGEGVV